ncbi:ABC transporter substrate-binding protein [Paenibacillus contaminans]|uniref:ABC transporter substrate-binding protein n=1 Tax=Paenibacillus contaminans TaxID=450362 RepID=A0A329MKX9_9BACL|nr:ABC transporter substrate-binding protein [Paenibacillus contaminans]RAV20228.1 ABC transporter substrate-binding protein [Paenibacillus contaminans]
MINRLSRKARFTSLLLVGALAAAIAGCGTKSEPADTKQGASPSASASASPSAAPKKETKDITIGYLAVMDDAQALLAKEAQFYEKQGLKAEMKLFGSGTDLIKAIVGGQVDAGVLGFTNAATWAAKGADLKVVGGAQMGFHSILVNKDSDIKSVADLKGKKLASQKQGSTADVVLNGVALADAQLTNKDLQMVYVEPNVAIQSLQAGKVDAAFVFEPFDKIAQKQFGAKQIYEIGKVWPFPCMVVITSGDVLSKDRDKVNRMLDAQKEAIELLQKDSAKAATFITKHFIEGESLDTPDGKVKAVDIIKESIDSQKFTWEITADDTKRMQEIIDIMVKQGSMEKSIKVEDILDLSWQKANK